MHVKIPDFAADSFCTPESPNGIPFMGTALKARIPSNGGERVVNVLTQSTTASSLQVA
jgi:hypothetical protein